jgi:hypothetical protein
LKALKNEQGIALITVFFILILLSVIGLSMMQLTRQAEKQQVFTDDEIQSKLLAEMGLLYFKENMETMQFNDTDINYAINHPSDSDSIIAKLETFAYNNHGKSEKKYKFIRVGDASSDSGFALGFTLLPFQVTENATPVSTNTLAYKSGEDGEPSQPYVRKLEITSIGIPSKTENNKRKRVMLTATVYLNTIPAPFHYAVSTGGELRLFGGSNIIGNVMAGNVVQSSSYRYLQNGAWKKTTYTNNTAEFINQQSYIEGKLLFANSTGGIYQLQDMPPRDPEVIEMTTSVPKDSDLHETSPPTSDSLASGDISQTRDQLRAKKIFLPYPLADSDQGTEELSAKKETPYFPGRDVPITETADDNNLQLLDKNSVQNTGEKMKILEFIDNKRISLKSESNVQSIVVQEGYSFSFEEEEGAESDEVKPEGGFFKENPSKSKILILSKQPKPDDEEVESPSLTVRLTGKALYNDTVKVNTLYIGPDKEDAAANAKEYRATVEMGRKSSFQDHTEDSGETSEPSPSDKFTFKGTIFIDGDLDIVDDIDITGTIYVNGNVTIREATNESSDPEKPNTLAIIASGKITLANRYTDDTTYKTDEESIKNTWFKSKEENKDAVPLLSAFLYSEGSLIKKDTSDTREKIKAKLQGLAVYSIDSINLIKGGISAGNNQFIEFNTKREPNRAARLTVLFDRNIFEQATPGLPAGEKFFIDLYDEKYKPVTGNEKIELDY